jgi:hypothetical protein
MDFYRGASDVVSFSGVWQNQTTYVEKLKVGPSTCSKTLQYRPPCSHIYGSSKIIEADILSVFLFQCCVFL